MLLLFGTPVLSWCCRSEEILSELVREASESVQSVDVARDVLLQACVTRGVDPGKVERAMTFLEKVRAHGHVLESGVKGLVDRSSVR